MGDLVDDPFRAARLILTLRRVGVTDNELLAIMERISRDQFIEEDTAGLAFEDAVLPIACGQTILRPSVTGQLLQRADLSGEVDRVLLVGLGSGYTAALIAQMVSHVFAIERYRRLFDQALANLEAFGYENVIARHGDGLLGWSEQGPYERIVLTGLAEAAPVALLQQLTPGGRLIQPILGEMGQSIAVYDSNGKLLNSQEITGFQPLSAGIACEL